MSEIDRDELLNKTGSIYKLVILAALRAIELSDGAAKLVNVSPDSKVTNIALEEILAERISFKVKEKK